MASSAVTQSMQRITATKLEAVSDQHTSFEATKARILDNVAQENAATDRIRILLDGLEDNKISAPMNISTKTVRAFLEQSKHDPSVSQSLLQSWEDELRECLDAPSRKYQHSLLFGRLAMEWLEAGAQQPSGEETGDSFEPVGRKEMHEQRKEWESLVLTPTAKPNVQETDAYLHNLFNASTEGQQGLKTIRSELWHFKIEHFNNHSLKKSIEHLLASDLLSPQKQAGLKELQGNALVLAEMSDVLNMQIDSLRTWSWGEPPELDVRRALNGKYRVFMDEELLQAILLQYIGVMWAAKLKQVLLGFMQSGAWKDSTHTESEEKVKSRGKRSQRVVKPNSGANSVRKARQDRYKQYFMQQLPTSFNAKIAKYDDDGDSDISDSDESSPFARKQGLFRLITTEALLNSRLHGSLTILQSDFRWFGPSLPHATILTVLEVLGVNPFWRDFCEKFLQTPMRFIQDGPEAQTVVRKSGVPISHALSDFMGEAVLFCLDFAINLNSGGNLYRIHDDIWFWGSNDAAVSAWKTFNDFNRVMKMEVNEKKTGSAQVTAEGQAAPSAAGLPKGSVTWGFLRLDSRGRWQVDQEKIKEHTKELQVQLAACKSIFAWIQAWNVYAARFFSTNLGQPARCLGKAHVDMVINTFTGIQQSLFSSDRGSPRSVTEYLKSQLQSRFGLSNITDGLLFFPIELGGLGLKNPLIPLLLVREDAPDDLFEGINDAMQGEEINYNAFHKLYDEGNTAHSSVRNLIDQDENFISKEDYLANVESISSRLLKAYNNLLEEPNQQEVQLTPAVENAIGSLPHESKSWRHDRYMQWIMQLYGAEVIKEFGGLSMGERRLLPIGLTSMLRSGRVSWQQ